MSAPAEPWQQFICRVCGLVYDERLGDPDGGLPPGTRFADIPEDWACPVCGVGKADFEPHRPQAPRPAAGGLAAPAAAAVGPRGEPGVVIVGAGRAGWELAQRLRDGDPALPITLVSACSADRYDKPLLSVAQARGLDPARLVKEDAAQASRRLRVRLLTDTVACGIDAPRRRLRTTGGTLRYRDLVLAMGAAPALPRSWPADQVWRINDLPAYRRLRAALGERPRRVTVIGAGLVGSELANDLALSGHQVTLLDQQPQPLAACLPAAAAQRLLQAWAGLPLRFIGAVQVAQVERGRVTLADGRTIDGDEVIAATGLRTPDRLARSAGLAFDDAAGGIVVDAHTGATSQPHIHALGDCVVVQGRASRFIEPLVRQAAALAAALLGVPAPAAATAAAGVLRVKTSSLPITLREGVVSAGDWRLALPA